MNWFTRDWDGDTWLARNQEIIAVLEGLRDYHRLYTRDVMSESYLIHKAAAEAYQISINTIIKANRG